MKLSDTQRVILSAAAQHEMGLARAPKALPAAARNAVFRSLIKNNLLTEINAAREHVGLGWRQDEDGTWIVARITDDGLRAIGIDPNAGDACEEDEQSAEAIARRNAERRATAEAATPVADTAPTGADEDALQGEDAPVPEAAQGAPLAQDEGNAAEKPMGHDDPTYLPIEQALIRAIGTITAHATDQGAWSRFCVDHADLVADLRAAAARRPGRAPRDQATNRADGTARKPREGTKQETVVSMLRREEGATIAQICEVTGWQQHTVRGFFAGLKKRQGIEVQVLERIRQVGPNKEGARGSYSIYRIAD
jgi:hypothetical protein